MTAYHVRRRQGDIRGHQTGRRLGSPGIRLALVAMCALLAPSGLSRLGGTSLDAAGQVQPTISIGDASVVEGNSGVTTLSFPVSLNTSSTQEVRVGFGTVGGVAGGTATGGLTQVVRQSPGVVTTIPDVGPASNYPINIVVSGVTGPIEQIDVTLVGLTHTNPSDVDVLLEAPSGEKMVILSDAGGATPASKVVMTLKDDASTSVPSPLTPGVFWPFSGNPSDSFPDPAPPGPYAEAGPAGPGTLNGVFRGVSANGTWKVWIVDDAPGNQGSIGNITLSFGVADPTADFVARFGQLVFPPGTTSKTIDVKVLGDTNIEPNETIFMDVFAPINGIIGNNRAVGRILDDDGGPGGLPPTTVNDAYQTFQDTPLQVSSPGVLANDMTNLGGPMSAQVVTQPSFGLLTLAIDGSFKYIPGPTFVGTDSFTYRAQNLAGQGNVATVTITVTPRIPPTAVDDKYYAVTNFGVIARLVDDGVLANDQANGGGQMTAELVAGPRNGTLTLNPDGSFVYRSPTLNFSDSFTYRVSNGNGTSNVATVSLQDYFTAQLLTDFRVNGIERRGASHRVTARFDPSAEGPPPTQYELQGGILAGQTLATLLTGSPYPIATFDAPTGSFKLRAVPVFGTDRGATSNEIDLHTNTTVTPSAPEKLLITVNGSNLDLAWQNTFRGGIPTNNVLNVTGAANLSVPLGLSETFSFAGVPSGTYNFTISAANATGSSANSNQVTATFPGACSGPPLTPENFLLYVDGLVLGAIWDLPAGGPAPTGYVLNVTSPIFNGPVTVRTTNVRAIVGSGVFTVTVTPFNSCGSGVPTPVQQVVKP